VGSLLGKFRLHYKDARHFGPAVLRRIVQQPDTNGYSVAKTRFGEFFVRRSDTDMEVLRQVFVGRDYDLDRFPQGALVRSAYEEALQRGKTPLIIDAGANAGFAACFFARAYPKARILSVEPDLDNAAICRANTKALAQVEVVEAAVGSRSGQVALERSDGHSWAVRTHRAQRGVPIVTIGELKSRVHDGELLIVKIDIEGFELDLFSESTEWIDQTCTVIVEPHDWMLPGAGTSRAMQRAMLSQEREMLISGENLVWVKRGP
jgi:FkbM family methyltransferase